MEFVDDWNLKSVYNLILTKYIRGQQGWSNSSEKQNPEYKKRMVGYGSILERNSQSQDLSPVPSKI